LGAEPPGFFINHEGHEAAAVGGYTKIFHAEAIIIPNFSALTVK